MGCTHCKRNTSSSDDPDYLPMDHMEPVDVLIHNDEPLETVNNHQLTQNKKLLKTQKPRKEFQAQIKTKLSKHLNEWMHDNYGVGGCEYIHFFIFKDIDLMDIEWTKNDNTSYDYLQSFWFHSKLFRDDCHYKDSDYFQQELQSEYKSLDIETKNKIFKTCNITDFNKNKQKTEVEEFIFEILLNVDNPNKNALRTISEIMVLGNKYLSELMVYGYSRRFIQCPKDINDLFLQYFGTLHRFFHSNKEWNWNKPPFNNICNKWKWKNGWKDNYKLAEIDIYNALYEIVFLYNKSNQRQNKQIKCYFCRGQRNRSNDIDRWLSEDDSLDFWWINITDKTCLFFRMYRMMSNDY